MTRAWEPRSPATTGFTYTSKGKRVSKLESCEVSFSGGALTVEDSGGVGDHIAWTVEAVDDAGNVGSTRCEVVGSIK